MKYRILPTLPPLFLLTACSSPITPSSDLLSGINSGAPIEILLGDKAEGTPNPFDVP